MSRQGTPDGCLLIMTWFMLMLVAALVYGALVLLGDWLRSLVT